MQSIRWDVFCTVIDNYGDIGIAWRLSRQLVNEYGLEVRLWVDDLTSFQCIRPDLNPERLEQMLDGVDIRRWTAPMPNDIEPADVVIEALACELPEGYVRAMASRTRKPLWINLEYLSAEDWIVGCHGLPSPHPRLPLVKYFFFPGWQPGTGGVLKERGLENKVAAFQQSKDLQDAFWKKLGVPSQQRREIRISLFAYENSAIPSLLETWSAQSEPIALFVPEGRPLAQVAKFHGLASLQPRDRLQRGQLTTYVLPMLDQDNYDRLLWACDCNFVRGEDSFVRAHWAGRPLVWQAYRQDEAAHWPKIEAFLTLYTRNSEPESAEALRQLWRAWNREEVAREDWQAFWDQRKVLATQGQKWMEHVSRLGDLADNLVHFCTEKL